MAIDLNYYVQKKFDFYPVTHASEFENINPKV